MTTAQQILKLIEEVSPDDTAKLDEIDARVFCLVHDCRIESYCEENRSITFWRKDEITGVELPAMRFHDGCGDFKDTDFPYYTRSRDALKRIRPEKAHFRTLDIFGLGSEFGKYRFFFRHDEEKEDKCIVGFGKTEELAELSAIIQAIEYERNNA